MEDQNVANISKVGGISFVNISGPNSDAARRVANHDPTQGCQTNDHDGQIIESSCEANQNPQDSGSNDEEVGTTTANQHVGQTISRILQDQFGTLLLQASRSSCPKWWSCIYHRPGRLNSPRLPNNLFGAISINCSGVPYLSSQCNEKKCKPTSSASTRVTYQFPSWLLERALSFIVVFKLSGPEMQMRVLRVIPSNAAIFRLAIAGDVEGMQTLLRQGTASIYDIDDTRWSILHKAFLNGQSQICKFLLDQGTNPALEACNGSSVIERAWHSNQTNTSYKLIDLRQR